jgi:hypothetical protein
MWELTNGFGDFDISWRRNLFEWEGRLLPNLLKVLEGFVCTKGTNDWKWKPEEKWRMVCFRFRQLTCCLKNCWFTNWEDRWNDIENNIFGYLWKAKAPSRVVVFS